MIRDPRDVILSQIKVKWQKSNDIKKLSLNYRKQFIEGRLNGKKLFRNKYIEIFYEDLLLKPAKTLKELTTKLKIPYHMEMLKYYNSANSLITEKEKSWKENISKPLMTENINKWESEFNKKDILQIENYLIDVFNDLPYNFSKYYEEQHCLQLMQYKFLLAIQLILNKLKKYIKRTIFPNEKQL